MSNSTKVHPTWELTVDSSALVLMPCPGTKELGLTESIQQLKRNGVKAIVTAITREEMHEKHVEELGAIAQANGISWIHLPIEDDAVPDEMFTEHWPTVSPLASQPAQKATKVALHCMGGSECTGLLAAHLLLDMNWELKPLFLKFKRLRPGAFTKPEQREYIENVAAVITIKLWDHYDPKAPFDQYYVESDFKFDSSIRQYMLVTFNYWNFTHGWRIEDAGGVVFPSVGLWNRSNSFFVLVLWSSLAFGTNLVGGWLGARLGLNRTMNIGPSDANHCAGYARCSSSLVDDSMGNGCSGDVWYRKKSQQMSAKSAIKTLVPDEQQGLCIVGWY